MRENKIKIFDFSKKKPQRATPPPRVQTKPKDPASEFRSTLDKLYRVEGKTLPEIITIMTALGTAPKQLAEIPRYLGLVGKWRASTSITIELNDYLTLMVMRRRMDLDPITLDAMVKAITLIIEEYLGK